MNMQQDGYEVLSPALFHREHPGFECDYTGPQFDRAVELARKMHEFDQSVADAHDLHRCAESKRPGVHHRLLLWRLGRVADGADFR